MSLWYRSDNRDDHLPPVGSESGETPPPPPSSLLRRILLSGENEDAYDVLWALFKKAQVGGPPPYLAIRGGKPAENRSPMVVIRYSRTEDEQQTGIRAVSEDACESEEAQAELSAYCEEALFALHAKLDTGTIRFRTLFERYQAKTDPDSEIVDDDELERLDRRRRSHQDPAEVARDSKLYADDILAIVGNWRLSRLNDDFGKDFHALAKSKLGLVADGTIGKRLTYVRKVFDWFRRKYRPPFRLEFENVVEKRLAKTELVWEEIRCVILHCLGYVWDTNGFATEWVQRQGEWVLRFQRHDADHVRLFAAVIRYALIYFFTGTRSTAITKLGWRPLNQRGWIDAARMWIYRNGRKSPNFVKKPQENGGVVPCVAELFSRMQAEDERSARDDAWVLNLETSYVVHDGRGGYPADVVDLAKDAFEAVGLDARRHAMKGGGATAHWHAGFAPTQIAWYFGNTEASINNSYRSRKNSDEANQRPRIDPMTATLEQIVDPRLNLPKVPRRDPPPPPGASIRDADRYIRDELESAIAKVLHE